MEAAARPAAERTKAGGRRGPGPEAQPAEQRALLATAGTSELRGGALTETSEKGMLPLPRGQSFV